MLLPQAPEVAARCYEWMDWLTTTVHAVAFAQLVRPQRFASDVPVHSAIIAKGRQNLGDAFRYVEQQLEPDQWSVSGRYTIVDPYLLFYYRAAQAAGVPMEARYPRWAKLTARVIARPTVQRVLRAEAESR